MAFPGTWPPPAKLTCASAKGASGALVLRELTNTTSKVLDEKTRSKVAGETHFKVSSAPCTSTETPKAHTKVRCEVLAENGAVDIDMLYSSAGASLTFKAMAMGPVAAASKSSMASSKLASLSSASECSVMIFSMTVPLTSNAMTSMAPN